MAEPPKFAVGTKVLSPNGCRTCECTAAGLVCDASQCADGAPIACDAWTALCPDGKTVRAPQPPDCAAICP